MAYAHARPGERCAKCNDLAVRVVGTQPHCLDHFTSLLDWIYASLARRGDEAALTPPPHTNPSALVEWGRRLKLAVADGAITEHDARDAWERARNTAA